PALFRGRGGAAGARGGGPGGGGGRPPRAAAALAALAAHLVAVLGFPGADLTDALCEPLWRDPTRVLARRHGERRRLRRGAVAALAERHPAPSIVPGTDTFRFPPGDPPARLTI